MKEKTQISIKHSFRIIQGVVGLLLVFLIVQGCVLWQICDRGVGATTGLEKEGLPSLRLLASLQEGLAVYRLHSYELMFAQDKDRPAKIAEVDAVLKKNVETIEALNQLYPTGAGHDFVAALQGDFNDYVTTMGQIRGQIDKDFAAAMKLLDEDVPVKVARLDEAAGSVKTYADKVAGERTSLTVDSFTRVRHYVVVLGSASIAFAVLAALLVTFNSSRVRGSLTSLAENLGEVSHALINSASSISGSSQTLATGSSKQASSIEETSASLEEMASVTKRNAENARKANELSRDARSSAEKGAGDMEAMSAAMQDIKKSSDDIAKIIRTIDEIAFQTNILALNAAVEAARAGEAGMGFAVVADEVRNLAQRSAQAAKETAAKIEGAINNTARGVGLSSKVAVTLNDIVDKSRQVDELAAEVAGASREQTQGITQINSAVASMDKVTQDNAASAEESAAAAQELNAQAVAMKTAVENLLRLVGRDGEASAPVKVSHDLSAPVKHASTNGFKSNGNGHHAANPASNKRTAEIPMEGDFRDF